MKHEVSEVKKEITEKVEKWIANDGTEFTTQEECRKYEESALYAVNRLLEGKIEDIPPAKQRDNLDILCNLMSWSEDEVNFRVFKCETADDAENIYKWFKLHGYSRPYHVNGCKIKSGNNYLLMTSSYDDTILDIFEESSLRTYCTYHITKAFETAEEIINPKEEQ